MRRMAAMTSVDLSITMTAAVPMPDLSLESVSKSRVRVSHIEAGNSGMEEPPGITASRLLQPPRTPPACRSKSSGSRMALFFFDHARALDVTGYLEQLGAGVVGLSQRRE